MLQLLWNENDETISDGPTLVDDAIGGRVLGWGHSSG